MCMSDVINLEVGQAAPNFSCIDSNGTKHSLKQYIKNKKSVILYFYPKDSTPGCTVQACDFRDDMARLISEGYQVFGVSKDSVKSHENFIDKQDINFPLLMDERGICFEADQRHVEIICRSMGLEGDSKAVKTPGEDERDREHERERERER